MTLNELPEPDDAALAHSERLRTLIVEKARASGGAISFSEYMNCALYEPGLGYYMAGAPKLGAEGDFITAPEVSPLFGQCLAVQITQVLGDVGSSVLELGAGSGRLALSIISALHSRPDFKYFILEPSAELIQRQQQLLRSQLPDEAMASVTWLDSLPATFDGVVLANEVMDALPVERFQVASGKLQQLCVTDSLSFEARPASDAVIKAVAAIEADIGTALPDGYKSEVSMLLAPWTASLAAMLGEGVVLLIDYGYPRTEYYSSERNLGTLACYYRHRTHDDPFYLPGLQDITAHVDFTAVVEAGLANELELIGYASQSAFLFDNDLLELADSRRDTLNSEMDRIMLAREIKTLTLPGEMGERFQVMALGKGYDRPLQGFSTQDLSYRL
ncbi:MAG: class I SAM-dependent methyltransferase [Granulosicoccus sp.]